MFETAGTLTIVELVSSLVALVLLPLFFAAVAAVAAVRGSGGRIAMRIAIATSGGAFGLAVAHAVRAAQMAPGRVAEQHVAQLVRIGQLDLSIDLVRDPTSATCAVLVTFLGFAAVLHAVWMAGERVAQRLAWTGLATSAIVLVVLADDLPTLAIGLQVATLAGWALAGGKPLRPLGLSLAGDTAVLFAAWMLFWSLGGTFGTSGYTPDPQPRFALVAVPDAPRPDGKSMVSLTTYEDSLVSSDDGPPLPGEPIRAPFSLVLDPGVYSFRIQANAATSDLLVTHVTLAPGHSYVLSPYGPTASFVNLGDQLAVPRPTPLGQLSMRAVLASRTMLGLHVTTVVGVVMLLAALLRLALLARTERSGIAYALEAIPPVVLALRLTPILDASAAPVLAIAPALAAILLAADGATTIKRDRVPRAALASLSALSVTAVLLGESAGAVVILVSATLGAAAATTALDSDADVRWLGVACAGLAGVLPGGGASPGISAAIMGAFGASASGKWAGAVVAPLITVAAMLLSLAAFRVYGASIRAPEVAKGPRGPRALVVVLASVALLGGAALGVGSSPFGGHSAPLARRLVTSASGGLDGVVRIAFAAFAMSLAAAVIGLVAAQRATRTSELPGWLSLLGAPTRLVSSAAGSVASLVQFFVRSVTVMNEDVVDDILEVFAGGLLAVGGGLRRIDARIGTGLVARALGRGADEAVVRTGLDDPHRFEGFRTVLVLGMVALLGLVVLSSVVLG